MVIRIEKGKIYRTGERGHCDYVATYSQPWINYAIAWMYHHLWEKMTWRFWRRLERFQKEQNAEFFFNIPFSNRQDLRCDHLHRKNRKQLEFKRGEWITKD